MFMLAPSFQLNWGYSVFFTYTGMMENRTMLSQRVRHTEKTLSQSIKQLIHFDSGVYHVFFQCSLPGS